MTSKRDRAWRGEPGRITLDLRRSTALALLSAIETEMKRLDAMPLPWGKDSDVWCDLGDLHRALAQALGATADNRA
jgi:hypothetical protein